MNPQVYRRMIAGPAGEPFRWLKAVPQETYDLSSGTVADDVALIDHGYVYLDKGLKRGIVQNETRNVFSVEQQSWARKSQLYLTTLPENCRPDNGDCFIFIKRTAQRQEKVTRATSGDSDVLGMAFPVVVVDVAQGATVYKAGIDFRLDTKNHAIVWLGSNRPTAETLYYCHYTYHPLYIYYVENEREPRPLTPDGAMSPVRGQLELKPAQI